MKKSYIALAFFAAVLMSGCTAWEESQVEYIPLPEAETPINPEPWEPGAGGNDSIQPTTGMPI